MEQKFLVWQGQCSGLNGSQGKDTSKSKPPEAANVPLFGRRVVGDIIKLGISRWDHLGFRVASKANDR